jgi:rhamnosyltransferase
VWEKTRFPEDYKVFEDVAIAKLILDGGWKIVYEPQAAVYHSHDFSTARLFKRYFDVGVVYRRLNIWDAKSKNMLRRDGLRSARSKLYLLRNGPGLKELGHGLCHDAAKCAGLLLGRNETLLPRAMKKWLSAFRLFD